MLNLYALFTHKRYFIRSWVSSRHSPTKKNLQSPYKCMGPGAFLGANETPFLYGYIFWNLKKSNLGGYN